MTMNLTATAVPIEQYPAYVHNCLRNRACERAFSAPLPGIAQMQLYVDFGVYKPSLLQFYLQSTCSADAAEQLFPGNYVVGQTPEGRWYGVFKFFAEPIQTVTSFVVWLSAMVAAPGGDVERTFFSEAMAVEACDPLMKLKACQPETATVTGFDVNGLYYGLPVNADFLGMGEVRYFHIAWVRQGKVREFSNKATFTQSLVRNFRTTVEKTFQLETELVPRWYKDLLLAIYARGAVQVDDGTTYLVSELAFEALNDDDLTWKPYARLLQTTRLYFGCDESLCGECCSPEIIDATATSDEESESAGSPGDESPGASESAGGGVGAGSGNVSVLDNCGTSEQQIVAVRFCVPPDCGDPEAAFDEFDPPVTPGTNRDVAFVSTFGTGDLQIYYDEDIFPVSIRVVDSMGNAYCGNSATGPGLGNVMVFPNIIISNTPLQQWTVELSCTPCP
jgi:hypothetical protein